MANSEKQTTKVIWLKCEPPEVSYQTWSEYFHSYVEKAFPIHYVTGANFTFIQIDGKRTLVEFGLQTTTNLKYSTGLKISPYLDVDKIKHLIHSLETNNPFVYQVDNTVFCYNPSRKILSIDCIECIISNCRDHHRIKSTSSLLEVLRDYILYRQQGPKIN